MGMNRMAFAAGFAAGYVVGARAGRERYDQIVKLARQAAEHPTVQQAAGTVQAQATGIAQKVGGQLHDKVPQMAHSAAHSVGGHIAGMRHKDGDGNSAPNGGTGAGDGSPFAATTDSGFGPPKSV
jgi:hypothetical protein